MSRLIVPLNERDHIHGLDTALVTLVEYGDYECPHCGAAYPIVKRIEKKMGDNLRFVFRNFPLTESHPHALHAAQAAEAASLQDKFWAMHNALFENQEALEDEDLYGYAEELKLDIKKWTRDFSSEAVVDKIEKDFNSGIRSGVNGTPTFFINGVRHDNSFEYSILLAALQEELAAQKQQHARPAKAGRGK
ncbi:MAG TPA: thioredoxin domain-containing protein [Anaerolineae bacterium]|nr:thioredoxin domain-containing protein [Anaerolineae bacterium]